MRKWMRDKLKRRKKSQEEAAAAPAPLQPAYFEPEPGPGPGEERAKEERARVAQGDEAREPEDHVQSSVPAAQDSTSNSDQNAAPASSSDATRRPRRRRRGGRGRRRPGQQQPSHVSPEPALSTEDSSPSASRLGSQDLAAAPSSSAVAQRPSKGVVVLAVGLPGSGKSSWFKRHSVTPLSSDVLRTLLFDDPKEQRFQDLVFSNLRSMLKARLIAHRPMNYVDATNLTPHERHNWIKLAKDFGYEVHAVFFDVPLETCIERHHRRDRIVPEDVMRKMSAKLKAPAFDEGFSKITVVRVKQK